MNDDPTINDHSETVRLASRLAGAIWGLLVGDALGVPYEFGPARPADTVVFGQPGGPWRQPAGTWSDDGALTLALLDSLLRPAPGGPAFDADDQGRRFRAWRDRGEYTPGGDGRFDIGATTYQALRRLDEGVDAAEAGPSGERACGNGSLMRVLPLALVFREDDAVQLIGRAHLASRVTHGHPRCQVACAVYCLAVAGLLRGQEPNDALATALADCEREYRSQPGLESHAGALAELRGWGGRSGGGFVLDSFWSAWDAFAGAGDFADAVRRAVAYGNDTDTTAAIAGGLAGARWGWDGIPLDWRRGMRGREVATPLVDRLVATAGARTSTLSPLGVNEVDLTATPLEGAGRVGITFLPGKKQHGNHHVHWRDLDADLATLRGLGVDALFLLVEDRELAECRVVELPAVMAEGTPELVRFPVHDPTTPLDPPAYRRAVAGLVERIRAGGFVAIACRGGLDRSGMTSACLLREVGLGFDEAIRRTQAARPGSITRHDERELVRAWPPAEPL